MRTPTKRTLNLQVAGQVLNREAASGNCRFGKKGLAVNLVSSHDVHRIEEIKR